MNSAKFTFQKIWKIMSAAGLFLGIVSSIIAIVTFLKVDRLEELAKKAREWKIAIDLLEPQNGTEASAYVIRIAGKADFRATAAQVESSPRVNLALQENQVDLVPFSNSNYDLIDPSLTNYSRQFLGNFIRRIMKFRSMNIILIL